MQNIIWRLLKKKGIESLDELDSEEKVVFDQWQAVLSKEELTLPDVKEFCKIQCEVIKQKWADYSIDQAKKAELLPYFTVYNSLLTVIDSPREARESLERHLESLIN